MPTVRLSAQTREELKVLLNAENSPTACIMIHKHGKRADVKRSTDGSTLWSIEDPGPWGASVVSGEALSPQDVLIIEGLRFWFAVLEPESIPPLELSVSQGKLRVHTAI